MNLVILVGLVVIGVIHAGRGASRVLLPRPRAGGDRGTVAPPLAGLVLALIGLLIGWSAGLPVPLGYAGGTGGLLLDPLGCVFLVLLFLVACVCEAGPAGDRVVDGYRDLRVSAMLLTFLAGDAFLLDCGAILATLLPGRLVGRRAVRQGVVAVLALTGACALLSGLSALPDGLLAEPGFVLLRAGGGGAPILLPVLAMLGVMPLLGLWPAQSAFRHQCAFAPVWVPITGLLLGLFLLVRLLLDLAGPVPSPGWGGMLIVLGTASALRAGLSTLSDRRSCGVLGSVLQVQAGFCVVGIGVCLLARSSDLPALAGSALDAVMLLLPSLTLGGLCALGLGRAIEQEAGSGLLARQGGLVQSMPLACLLMLLPLALLGVVPPVAGFAAVWLLVQCVLATQLPLPGGIAVPSLLLLLGLCGAVALNGCGLLRLCWIAALGRPRTPRGAAATDLDRSVLRQHALVLCCPLLVGLVPGAWLAVVSGPSAQTALIAGVRRPLFGVVSPAGSVILWPLPLAVLLALFAVLSVLLARVLSVRPERRQRGWDGGGAPPPPWLPFGDPATQIAPATLLLALQQAIGLANRGPWPFRIGSALLAAGQVRVLLRQGRAGSLRLRSLLLDRGAMLGAVALGAALLALLAGVGVHAR